MTVLGDRDDFNPVFQNLDKNGAVFKDISELIRKLKKDEISGERIKYHQIPKYYKNRHGVDNAFHVYLPEGMRLIYSITTFHNEKTAFLMELFDHKNYENRFNY